MSMMHSTTAVSAAVTVPIFLVSLYLARGRVVQTAQRFRRDTPVGFLSVKTPLVERSASLDAAFSGADGSARTPYKAVFKRANASWGAKVFGVEPTDLVQNDKDRLLQALTKQVHAAGHGNVHVALSIRRGCIMLQLAVWENRKSASEASSGDSADAYYGALDLTSADVLALLPADIREQISNVKIAGAAAAAAPEPTPLSICLGAPASADQPLLVRFAAALAGEPQFFLGNGTDPLASHSVGPGLYQVEAPVSGWNAPEVLTIALEGEAETAQVPILPANVFAEVSNYIEAADPDFIDVALDLTALLTLRCTPCASDPATLESCCRGVVAWAQARNLPAFAHSVSALTSTEASGPSQLAAHETGAMSPWSLMFHSPALEARYTRATLRYRLGSMTAYLLMHEIVLLLIAPGSIHALYGRAFHPLAWVMLPMLLILSLTAVVTKNMWAARALLSYAWFVFIPSRLVLRQESVCTIVAAGQKFTMMQQLPKALGQSVMAFTASYFITLPFLWKASAIFACTSTIMLSFMNLPTCKGLGLFIPFVYLASAYSILPMTYRREKKDRISFVQSHANANANKKSN